MKSFGAVVASAFALFPFVTAQSQCGSVASAIPSCGQACLLTAGSAIGCSASDYNCQCSSSSALQASAQNCVISACGIPTALSVQASASAVCACVASATPAAAGPVTAQATPAPGSFTVDSPGSFVTATAYANPTVIDVNSVENGCSGGSIPSAIPCTNQPSFVTAGSPSITAVPGYEKKPYWNPTLVNRARGRAQRSANPQPLDDVSPQLLQLLDSSLNPRALQRRARELLERNA